MGLCGVALHGGLPRGGRRGRESGECHLSPVSQLESSWTFHVGNSLWFLEAKMKVALYESHLR